MTKFASPLITLPSSMALRFSILIASLMSTQCTTSDDYSDRMGQLNQLTLALSPVRAGTLLPGGRFYIHGSGLLARATYTVTLLLPEESPSMSATLIDSGSLEVMIPVDYGLSLSPGALMGALVVHASLDQAYGEETISFSAQLTHLLSPQIDTINAWTAPGTPSVINAAQLLLPGEGQSSIFINGQLTNADGRVTQVSSQALLEGVNSMRDQGYWVATPIDWGIEPGIFTGQVKIINQAQAGVAESPWFTDVTFTYRRPQVTSVQVGQSEFASSSATILGAHRGEWMQFKGWGFIGASLGGITTLRFQGSFTPHNTLASPQSWSDLPLNAEWRSGEHLQAYLDVTYDDQCESEDLGGRPGSLSGEITPIIDFGGLLIEGERTPIELEILGNRQVIYISFLPAFTDSLRLFGLRNVSAQVIDEIIGIVSRDYEGINVDLRLTPPEDYALYSVIEIGGPDPNAQSLFGLDNTAGLDLCNQRLDDVLGGKNADSGGTFGGVFVESFLNLSPRRGDNPLADPLFDEIFDPVIATPATVNEVGDRALIVDRAIRALGHLVGNTLTHELGHSMGLPVFAGCGQYHNAPGELQIMDCGQDRPFIERVGLDPRGVARWTPENEQYLKKILPIE
jgi:hypothetical protein